MGTSSSLINRRGVLLSGAAAATALSLPASAVQPDLAPPSELIPLGAEFDRLHRRCARQGRRVRQLAARVEDLAMARNIRPVGHGRRHNATLDILREEVGYHTAWARWSATYDRLSSLAGEINRQPARAVADMVIKYEALRWSLLDDGAVFDSAVRRQVVAFRRDLVALAGSH